MVYFDLSTAFDIVARQPCGPYKGDVDALKPLLI